MYRNNRTGWVSLRNVVFLLLVLVSWGGNDSVRAENRDSSATINEAGRQRMLTQRIVKAYCQIGLQVNAEISKSQLESALLLFEKQLGELEAKAPNPEVAEALDQVRQIWVPFAFVGREPVSREGAKRLLFWNDDLLHASNKVVQLLQDASGDRYARLVNIAGRQRMLSQRLAKFYFLREWGFDSLTIQAEQEAARNEFEGALSALAAAPENSKEITKALEEVSLQWAWFKHAVSLQGEEAFRLIVADSSEEILQSMEEITGQYQEISGNETAH